MTLKEKVLQTFIVTIREINKFGGPEKFFEQYKVGGMYFSVWPESEGKIERGTGTNFNRLKECRKFSKTDLLVCADGAHIPGQKIFAGARSLAASKDAEDAYNFGKIIGMQMNYYTVDWVLGPSIDMLYDRSMPLGAISDDPKITASIYRNVVRGIQDQGVCATAKHFPGLGTSNINMHFGPGKNVLPFDEWMDTYGYTYQEMFKENVMSVMTTHETLKSYTEEKENGFMPIATFSHKLTTELLKEKLGFDGAVVTDALIMGGMATGDLVAETVQAFRSGADLLLWPPMEAADKIVELLESGDIPMSRLDDALNRIQKLRDFRKKALDNHAYDTPDTTFTDTASHSILEHGITLYRNSINLIPLDRDKIKNILIIDAADETTQETANLLKNTLEKEGFQVSVQRDIYDVPSRVCWQDDIDALQAPYDAVIFSIHANYSTDWNVPFMLIWASQLFNKSKKIILNYGSPFFAEDYFENEFTIIEANTNPSEISVNLIVDKMLGKSKFTGQKVLNKQVKYR